MKESIFFVGDPLNFVCPKVSVCLPRNSQIRIFRRSHSGKCVDMIPMQEFELYAGYLCNPSHPEKSRQTNTIQVPLRIESPERVVRGIRSRKHTRNVEHTYARHSR